MKNTEENLKEIGKLMLGFGAALILVAAIYYWILQYEVIIAVCLIMVSAILFSLIISPEKKKKTARLFLVPLVLCLLWLVCVDKVEIPDDTSKITVAVNGGSLATFSYTEEEKINTLVEYFTSVNPRLAIINPNNTGFAGMSWLINVETDTENFEMVISGNFLKMPDGTWRSISFLKEQEFDDLVKETIPDEMPQNDKHFRDFGFDKWYAD